MVQSLGGASRCAGMLCLWRVMRWRVCVTQQATTIGFVGATAVLKSVTTMPLVGSTLITLPPLLWQK